MSQEIDFTKAPENTQRADVSVTYCTSESDVHRANNVILEDRFRIWQTKEPAQRAVIELQFASPTLIKAIDLVNAGSAFIEVLVGQSTWEPTEFQVLLPVTNFMSYSESHKSSGRTKAMRFTPQQFSKETFSQKWEKIRVSLTQPFSSDAEIGISSIAVYVNDPMKSSSSSLNRSKSSITREMLDKKEKEDEQPSTPPMEGEPVTSKSLLSERTKTYLGPIGNGEVIAPPPASAIVMNPLPGEVMIVDNKSTKSYEDDEDTEGEEETKSKGSQKKRSVVVSPLKVIPNNLSSSSSAVQNKTLAPSSNDDDDNTEDEAEAMGESLLQPRPKEVPSYSKVLQGVVLVIGGIENPEKGLIRDRALEMGAEYRPSWCREATHLITPFAGTPKFLEAKRAGGTIASPKWVHDCSKEKLRLPIQNYLVEEKKKKARSDDENDSKQKNKNKSVSTTDKKRKNKKENPDSDDSEDDSHIPNEFDYSDGFLVDNLDEDEEKGEDDDGDNLEENYGEDGEYLGKHRKENLNDLFKDGVGYLKRTFNFNQSDYLLKSNKEHPSKKFKPSPEKSKQTEIKEKSVINNNNNNNNNHNSNNNNDNNNHTVKTVKIISSSQESNTPSSQNLPKAPPPSQSSQQTIKEETTQAMSPEQINKEINRLILKEKSKQLPSSNDTDNDVEMTDINEPKSSSNNNDDKKDKKSLLKPTISSLTGKEYIIDPLATFFDGIEFYLSVRDNQEKNNLYRYIIAYKGTITKEPKPTTRFVITDKTSWDKLFDLTRSRFPNVLFVPPSFIHQSHLNQQLVQVEKYLIQKS